MLRNGLHIIMICVVLWGIGGALGCRKVATLTQGGVLKFSTDTLAFDTVFTAEGSYTNSFVIYNPQSEAVIVSSIKMENGAASYFHLNVDGFVGNNVTNIRIAPHDSAYVFATVKINPNDSLTPFLITDAMIATMNGKQYRIPFTAYGQNAHYIISDSLAAGTTNWLTDKPYVVIHNCIVGPFTTLNIPRGCRVYMHQDAQIVVWPAAMLNIGQTGNTGDSVVFQGDRLDRAYFGYVGYPGEWCGLWFLPRADGYRAQGSISNTILKNCGNGAAYLDLYVQPAAIRVDDSAYVHIDHSAIRNSISLGLFALQGSITAIACNVNTTGGEALALQMGGPDTLLNCTFANYGSAQVSHASAPTAVITDWFEDASQHFYYGNLNALIQNTIVYGSLDSEIICDTSYSYKYGNYNASVQFVNCLLKMGQVREPFVQFTNTIFNQDPMFKSTASGDFHLSGSSSPAWGHGANSPLTQPMLNAEDSTWQSGGIDIGCY